MNHRTHNTSGAHVAPRRIGFASIALLGVIATAGNAHADSAASRWQVSFPVYLSAGAYYQSDGETTDTFQDVAGDLFEHPLRGWDTTASLFDYDSRGASGLWKYFGRVRYGFAARHKLAIEVVGPLRDPSASNLMVGYYGTITESFSVNFVVGSKFRSGQKNIVRTELVWHFN